MTRIHWRAGRVSDLGHESLEHFALLLGGESIGLVKFARFSIHLVEKGFRKLHGIVQSAGCTNLAGKGVETGGKLTGRSAYSCNWA